MKTQILSNAKEILQENFTRGGVTGITLREYVELEAGSDPSIFYWLFPGSVNLTGDFGRGLSDSEQQEYHNFLNTL